LIKTRIGIAKASEILRIIAVAKTAFGQKLAYEVSDSPDQGSLGIVKYGVGRIAGVPVMSYKHSLTGGSSQDCLVNRIDPGVKRIPIHLPITYQQCPFISFLRIEIVPDHKLFFVKIIGINPTDFFVNKVHFSPIVEAIANVSLRF
jgi:hypothetical protein